MMVRSLWGRVLQLAWWSRVYLPPDRRILERMILPQLAADRNLRRVLSVGVKFYTARYGRGFRPGVWVTMDADAAVQKHGAAEHVVGRIENAEAFAPGTFDAIVANGVIGWGLNSREGVEAALLSAAAWLRPGGWLILGLNEKRPQTPPIEGLAAWDWFEAKAFPGLPADRLVVATPFDEREHTFLFFCRRVTPLRPTHAVQPLTPKTLEEG